MSCNLCFMANGTFLSVFCHWHCSSGAWSGFPDAWSGRPMTVWGDCLASCGGLFEGFFDHLFTFPMYFPWAVKCTIYQPFWLPNASLYGMWLPFQPPLTIEPPMFEFLGLFTGPFGFHLITPPPKTCSTLSPTSCCIPWVFLRTSCLLLEWFFFLLVCSWRNGS